MTDNNVIQFPKFLSSEDDEKRRLPQTEDEVMKAIAVNRMVFVDEIVNQTFSTMATRFYQQGFPVDEDAGLFFRSIQFSGKGFKSLSDF